MSYQPTTHSVVHPRTLLANVPPAHKVTSIEHNKHHTVLELPHHQDCLSILALSCLRRETPSRSPSQTSITHDATITKHPCYPWHPWHSCGNIRSNHAYHCTASLPLCGTDLINSSTTATAQLALLTTRLSINLITITTPSSMRPPVYLAHVLPHCPRRSKRFEELQL